MNRKGFTLVELLATLVILGIVVGITIVSVSSIFKNTKEKSEDVFVDTIKDAMEMYLNSKNVKKLHFEELKKNEIEEGIEIEKKCYLNKTHGRVKVYKIEVTFADVINSEFESITSEDLVNPANKDVTCSKNFSVTIYKDDDFVYYYSIDKSALGCLKNSGVITNLPGEFVCE